VRITFKFRKSQLRITGKYLLHGVLFALVSEALAFLWIFLFLALLLVGFFIGAIIGTAGFIIGIIAAFILEFTFFSYVFGYVNAVITERTWHVHMRNNWKDALLHGVVLFVTLVVVQIPGVLAYYLIPTIPTYVVAFFVYCLIDGFVARRIAVYWEETYVGQRITWFRVLTHALAGIIALIWIIPFFGVFMSSVRPYADVRNGWWNDLNFIRPGYFDLSNYADAWLGQTSGIPLSTSMLNSLIVTIPATFIPILVAAIAAYSFARFSSRTKDLLFLVIVLLQTIPQQMVIVPIYFLYSDLHLLNNYIGLILLHTAFGLPWMMLFLRNFFGTIPIEIEEAARVDGASYFKVFYKIVLPLTLPALASLISLQFVFVWNDFFFALTTITNPTIRLAPQVIPLLVGRYQLDWSLLAAASVIVMIIPVGLYIALQKYYVRGLTSGAVKG
jgi:multiple sugar transport system permease protein